MQSVHSVVSFKTQLTFCKLLCRVLTRPTTAQPQNDIRRTNHFLLLSLSSLVSYPSLPLLALLSIIFPPLWLVLRFLTQLWPRVVQLVLQRVRWSQHIKAGSAADSIGHGGTCYQLLQMAGHGAPWVEEQRTKNWPGCTAHHESAHQTTNCTCRDPKKWKGTTKKFQRRTCALTFKFVPAPLYKLVYFKPEWENF